MFGALIPPSSCEQTSRGELEEKNNNEPVNECEALRAMMAGIILEIFG